MINSNIYGSRIRIEGSRGWAGTVSGVVFTFLCLFSGVFASQPVRACEPIRSTMCKGLGYNVTGMPNLVEHADQEDAILQLQTFTPLIQYNCSHRLKFFLCSVYFPMCTDKVLNPIGPCRPLCESVRDRCKPVLHEFGYPWPEVLNCSKFPTENNHENMCMEGPHSEEPNSIQRPTRLEHTTDFAPGHPTGMSSPSIEPKLTNLPKQNSLPCQQFGYKNYDIYTYINRTERCALLCEHNDAFTEDNKNFANVWMSVWASLCFVSALFTVLTFIINSQRFRYPERPIVFIAACYCFHSIAYIVRLIAGRDAISCSTDIHSGRGILIQEGLENTDCVIVFLIMFFFGVAGSLWWVVLTLTWFLSAGLRWRQEVIQSYNSYYHLAAWVTPAIKTIVILVIRDVDADELTGMCFVGNQDTKKLMGFVIGPHIFYLIMGASFLIAGFTSMLKFSKKSSNRAQAINSTEATPIKLEARVVWIGAFSVLYIFPTISTIACLLYEYTYRDTWYRGTLKSSPNIAVLMLKIFMSHVVGISTGIWILSTRTDSWKTQFRRILAPRRHGKGLEYAVPVHHCRLASGKPGLALSSRTYRSGKSKRGKPINEIIV